MEQRAFYLKHMNEHIQYLRKINHILNDGEPSLSAASMHCRLGQWLRESALQDIKDEGEAIQSKYADLLKYHHNFHIASDQALACHAQNDEVGRYRHMTQMYLLSNQLVQTLLQMDRISRNLAPVAQTG